MQYFVYGRDRPGSFALKMSLNGAHWSFMDRYLESLIARGPTLTGTDDQAESTGSLHIVDLPDAQAAREFAYDEPYYRAGVFASVQLCRFDNVLGRSMWDFPDAVDGYDRFLVIGPGEACPTTKPMIAYGNLLTLDGATHLGRAALVEAPNRAAAALALACDTQGPPEVHHWRFGGRQAPPARPRPRPRPRGESSRCRFRGRVRPPPQGRERPPRTSTPDITAPGMRDDRPHRVGWRPYQASVRVVRTRVGKRGSPRRPRSPAARGRSSAIRICHSCGSRAATASSTEIWFWPAAAVGSPVAGSIGRWPTSSRAPPGATPAERRRTIAAPVPARARTG